MGRNGRVIAMADNMSIRLTGSETDVDTMVDALRGMPEVESVVELSMDAPQRPDDSSSAGLPDDTESYSQDLEVDFADDTSNDAADDVQGRIETLASDAGLVVEWLDNE